MGSKKKRKKKPEPAREVCRPRCLREPGFSRTNLLIIAAILTTLALLTYSNTFSVPFLHDGIPSIKDNPHIRNLWPVWEAMRAPTPSTLSGRPIVSLSFALNHAISGLDVWSYHLFNLLFHVLSALLLFGIIRRTLLCESLREKFGSSSTILALASAAIWLVHPLHTTAVTYLVQRTESLMGLFYLLTFYCAIRAFDSKKSTRWYALSILACILGVGAKESMITAPVVILIYDRIFVSRNFKELLSSRWWFYLLLATTWAIVLTMVFSGSRSLMPAPEMSAVTRWQYLVTQSEAIVAVYLKLSFWPHPLVFDYGAIFRESLSSVIPHALGVLLLLAATTWALFKKPQASFLGIWFFANLALTSSVINLVAESMAERRMYLSLAAVATGAVIGSYLLLKRLRPRAKTALAVSLGGLAVLALGALTFARNADFESGERIWEDTVKKLPQNARAWTNLGNQYSQNEKYPEALHAFETSIRTNPGFAAYLYRGITYDKMGDTQSALRDLDRAVELNPYFAESFRGRGVALTKTGELEKAILDFDKAIELKPDFAEALDSRGSAYGRIGKPSRAIDDFNRAIELKPDLAEAYNNRGKTYAQTGEHSQAFRDFKKALELDPHLAEAYANRGDLYDDTGKFKEAIADFDKAIELYPNDSDLYNSRGIANGKSGNQKKALEDFQKAIELNPNNANAVLNAGITLEGLGKPQEAVDYYRQALRLRSDWPMAQKRLARLEGRP